LIGDDREKPRLDWKTDFELPKVPPSADYGLLKCILCFRPAIEHRASQSLTGRQDRFNKPQERGLVARPRFVK
jgi:hypothetical protein